MAPVGHDELGCCCDVNALLVVFQYWAYVMVAEYGFVPGAFGFGSGMPWLLTVRAPEQEAKVEFGCCWIAEVTSADALLSMVSSVVRVRCSPEPAIEVAKAKSSAVAAMPITVMAIRISMSVSPASERAESTGTGTALSGVRRRLMSLGAGFP